MAIERIVPDTMEWEAYYANHINRYEFAVANLKNISVNKLLDSACGVGYGSEYLAKQFDNASIIAIDRSEEALQLANKHFNNSRVRFIKDDCHTLAAANNHGPFDAIVSFETLEHLPHPEKFLSSCFANLKDGGKLIISTPNQLSSSPTGLEWEFHEKEYKPEELQEVLEQAGFRSVDIYGQRFTSLGKFRQQMRAEFNRIHSNPFMRIGKSIQQMFRKCKFPAILAEQPEDIEIVKYPDIMQLHKEGVNGPFVLIAIVNK